MITDELEKEATKLEKYLNKQGRETLVTEIKGLTAEELKKRVQDLALYRQEIFNTKANDIKLQDVAEEKKGLEAPYKEQVRMNDKITRFASLLLKDLE